MRSALAFLAALAAAQARLSVDVDAKGGFQLSVNNVPWLASSQTAVFQNGQWVSSLGALKIASTQTSSGSDALGSFTRQAFTWTGLSASGSFVTAVRDYTQGGAPYVVFEQRFDAGLGGLTLGNENGVETKFPTFASPLPAGAPALGYLTFAGNMACAGAQRQCTYSGQFNQTARPGIPGGIAGGAPLVLFDASSADSPNTLVVSPLTNFMATSHVFDPASGEFASGLLGSVTSVPAGFVLESIVAYSGAGVTDAFDVWGGALRTYYNKQPMSEGVDFTVDYLGYYTDNGAYYYYITEPNKTYAQTMIDVATEYRTQNIPIQYQQLDSWWYYKGPENGVVNWTAMPSVFPNGIDEVWTTTRLPYVAHNRYWSHTSNYARQNGGDYDFIVETTLSIPVETRFWRDLFRNSSLWGLRVYEQDWLHNEFEGLNATLQSATLGRTWLLQMGQAAEETGIKIQYCMPYPRHILQSVELPAVTQIRASDDYNPNNDQWSIGVSSLLAHAVGLAPFKDDFWSSSLPQPGNKYHAANEVAPILEALVATLSTGPVGPSDMIGAENRTNILRTCAADGLLLKPSLPATAIDATFGTRAFGAATIPGPAGELWTTYSQNGAFRWGTILAAHLDAPYTIRPTQLKGGIASQGLPLVAFSDLNPQGAVSFDSTSGLSLTVCDKTSFQLWHVAPVHTTANGRHIAVFGDVGKFVPLSPRRVRSFTADSQDLRLTLRGATGEVVNVTFFDADAKKTVVISCTFGASGSAFVSFANNLCASP